MATVPSSAYILIVTLYGEGDIQSIANLRGIMDRPRLRQRLVCVLGCLGGEGGGGECVHVLSDIAY